VADTHIQQWKEHRKSHWLTQAWSEGFLEALRALDPSGVAADLQLEVQDPNPALWAAWGEPLWLQLTCDAAEGASITAGCTRETAHEIAKIISAGSDSGDENPPGAYQELLGQAAGFLGTAASAKLKKVVRLDAPTACSPLAADEAALGIEFLFRIAETNHLLALVPNVSMLAAIAAAVQGKASQEEPAEAAPKAGPVSSDKGGGPVLSQNAQYNLELLLEVELDLSVSFGETVLPLQDVLKLASGSIVELNRSAADPVDLLVNNSVIARGEVVVVDGNYGVRVTGIVSRKERIQSIF
jgi:flagellar motor switch protein FliN/FliY